jgi:hypothetical protein
MLGDVRHSFSSSVNFSKMDYRPVLPTDNAMHGRGPIQCLSERGESLSLPCNIASSRYILPQSKRPYSRQTKRRLSNAPSLSYEAPLAIPECYLPRRAESSGGSSLSHVGVRWFLRPNDNSAPCQQSRLTISGDRILTKAPSYAISYSPNSSSSPPQA